MNNNTSITIEPSRRELNIGSPWDFFAYYLCNGLKKNIVITEENFIFEASPLTARLLHYGEYSEWTNKKIREFSSCTHWLTEAMETHVLSGLRKEKSCLIIESDVHSPFLSKGVILA